MAHLEAILGKLTRTDDHLLALPGDEYLEGNHYQLTHSVDIEASPAIVWAYLMQLGCDRAGWYSIDELDHGGVPSLAHLVPGWESRYVGDQLAAFPDRW